MSTVSILVVRGPAAGLTQSWTASSVTMRPWDAASRTPTTSPSTMSLEQATQPGRVGSKLAGACSGFPAAGLGPGPCPEQAEVTIATTARTTGTPDAIVSPRPVTAVTMV